MLEKSILNEELIKELINYNYNISVSNIKTINKGSACIYNINDEYILKEYSSDRNVELIENEYKVINHVARKGLNVPEYVLTNKGKCYITYKNKIIIVQRYLRGYTLENNTGDYKHTMISAKILGNLSKALEDFELKNKEYKFDTKEDLIESIKKLSDLKNNINNDNPYKNKFIDDLNKKINICNKLLDFNFDKLNGVTLKVCHGDYSVQQLIFDEDRTSVIDFETVKYMPIVWEIIRSYSYIDKDCINGEFNLDTFIKYVNEIKKYIDLNEYDLKYMPYIYIFQLVGSTFGYKQYNEDYTKTSLLDFAFFRTKLCIYLFNNLDTISNRLLSM